MTEKEQTMTLMDKYVDLQRIKDAPDRDSEIEYQIRVTKAKLEAIGVVTEKLEK